MNLEIEKARPLLLHYEVKDGIITKNYFQGRMVQELYSLENEMKCLEEMKRDLPEYKEFSECCIGSIKKDLILLNSYFGAGFYGLLYSVDYKSIPTAVLSAVLGYLTFKRYCMLRYDYLLKEKESNGPLKIYYENVFSKYGDIIEEFTECYMVFDEDESIDVRHINHLKYIKAEILKERQDMENNLDDYEEEEEYSKVYELK